MVAVLLHLVAGMIVTQWPGLLMQPSPPATEQDPLRFRFVDTPDVEEVVPEETAPLSDRDRRAADASPRDQAEDPFSEGNTPQPVLRSPEVAVPAVETTPARPLTPPVEETAEAPTETEADPVAGAGERAASESTEEARESAETAEMEPAPAELPRRPQDLRRSLTRLESFVDPQVYENSQGGAADSDSLAQFDTRGYDLGAYLRRVLRRIETNWRSNIPPLIRTGVGGATFIGLSIRRQTREDGEEVAVIVADRVWTSGQAAYDSAARFALEVSSPLPPIPDYYPHDVISGRLGFIYNMDTDQVTFPQEQH